MQATSEEVREYVINLVANDYESMATVRDEAIKWAVEEGKDLSESAVVQALLDLVRDGFVDCFEYRPEENRYEKTSLDPSRIAQYWYFVSKLGARSLSDS
jgi:hypothetical protein